MRWRARKFGAGGYLSAEGSPQPVDRWVDEMAATLRPARVVWCDTVAARQCPSLSSRWEDPQGVPLSTIIFGGRRARLAPLVFQSRDWTHRVFLGASVGSETT